MLNYEISSFIDKAQSFPLHTWDSSNNRLYPFYRYIDPKKSQRYTFYTSTDKVKIFYIDLTYLCLGIWIIVTGLYNTLLTYLCYHRNSPICLFDRPINNVNIIIYPFDMLNHYFTYPFCSYNFINLSTSLWIT